MHLKLKSYQVFHNFDIQKGPNKTKTVKNSKNKHLKTEKPKTVRPNVQTHVIFHRSPKPPPKPTNRDKKKKNAKNPPSNTPKSLKQKRHPHSRPGEIGRGLR